MYLNLSITVLFLFLIGFDNSQVVPKVLDVKSKGKSGNYTFSVKLASPDTGCEQYADWWEVLDEEGKLLYRRVLGHSHVNEQPFTRSGGPVVIEEQQVVIVRLHMNNSGYSRYGSKGSIQKGFEPFEIEVGFATGVEKEQPQPSSCGF